MYMSFNKTNYLSKTQIMLLDYNQHIDIGLYIILLTLRIGSSISWEELK